MNTSIGIYLIIGIVFAAATWFQRGRHDIPHPYLSATAAFFMWPIFLGIIVGHYVKLKYYQRKKDGQPK